MPLFGSRKEKISKSGGTFGNSVSREYSQSSFQAIEKEMKNVWKVRVDVISKKNNLRKILLDPILCSGFHQFLKKNFAEENYCLWVDIQRFKNKKFSDQGEIDREYNCIMEKYFTVGAECEVNTDLRDMLQFEKEPCRKSFDLVQKEIYTLMEMDSLSKFMRSETFQQIVEESSPTLSRKPKFTAEFSPIEKIINELTFGILESLISFVKEYENETKAILLEKKMLNVGLKVSLLFHDHRLKLDDFDALKEPLHKLCDKVIDAYEIPFTFDASEVSSCALAVKQIMDIILSPFLQKTTMDKIDEIFKYFTSDVLLLCFFKKKKWKQTEEIAIVLRKIWEEGYV